MRSATITLLLLPFAMAGCGVELLTTTAIQGELAAQSAQQGMKQMDNAKEMKSDIEVGQAIRLYQAENGVYPPSLEVLVPEYLASVPAGYSYNPETGQFGAGGAVGGGSGTLGNSVPTADLKNMLAIREAINAYGTATGFYPATLQSLVPGYLPELPLAASGEPYIYNNIDGDVIHPSRVGQPTTNYAEGGGTGGYTSGFDTSDSFSGSAGSKSSVETRRDRSAAQFGGMSPGGFGSPAGQGPNPKATIDRTKSNLNQALSGRGAQ